MKSIQANIKKSELENKNYSTYLHLATAVKGKKLTRKSILLNFNKYVEKYDYLQEEKMGIIDHLYHLSNPLEEGQFEGKNQF